jgi:RNA polymerase sigma-70 factor, ECF subfamily
MLARSETMADCLAGVVIELSMEQDEILSKLRARILAFAASRLRKEAAEDLVQDTLLLLQQKYGHVSRLEELVPLALRIVRFKIVAAWRKARRRGEDRAVPVEEQPLPDFSMHPGRSAESRELLERMKLALRQLSGRCRELFAYKLDGLAFPEIQQRMRASSLNTVYTWDHRCREQLRKLLGNPWV